MREDFVLNESQQVLVEENLNLVDILLRTKIHPNQRIRGMEYDELYQCGCLALCKAAATYDGRVKFRTYAGTVVVNAMIDQCRSARRQYDHTLSSDIPLADGETGFADCFPDPQTVEDALMSEELTKILREAKTTHHGAVLRGIEAIELQLKGYSGAEIARMYGVKNNNVTSWISKARVVLNREYKKILE